MQEAQYSVRLDDGQSVLISAEILPYFMTLKNMLEDFGSDMPLTSEGYTVIPVSFQGLGRELMQAMIDFYVIYAKEGLEGIERALNDENAHPDFYRQWLFILDDERDTATLLASADFLDARVLLMFLHDRLYRELERSSTRYLETRYAALLKRKWDSTASVRGWRLQYKRAWLIRAIMTTLLPYTLVRGIDTRIRQYPSLVIDSQYLSVIRHGERNNSIFLRHAYLARQTAELSSTVLSLSKGYQALYREELSEVVLGELFMGVLNAQGKLSLFGEFTIRRANFFGSSSQFNSVVHKANEEPLLERKECVGVWNGAKFVIALTLDALYIWGQSLSPQYLDTYEEGEMVLPFPATDVIEVSCGNRHALILTKQGLYGWGANEHKQMEPLEAVHFPELRRILIVDKDEQVAKIWASGTYSVVLLANGRLYGAGNIRGLVLFGDTTAWRELPLPVKGSSVSFIGGTSEQLVIVVDNRLWQLNQENGVLSFQEFRENMSGEILELTGYTNYLLVRTTQGLFIINDTAVQLKEFGGARMLTWPNQLDFVFAAQEEDAQQDSSSNKKPRLGCHHCFATSVFVQQSTERVFCSRYCLYTQ